MDIRNDPQRFDDRLDESADTPPLRPVPVDTHDNDDAQPAPPSDQVVLDQAAQPPSSSASPVLPVSLLGSDPADVRDRWHDLQACFVDDPRDAVQRADSLLEEVTASAREALESRLHELQDLWKNTGDHDTEQLRLALRSYRDVMHRLLPLADEPVTR